MSASSDRALALLAFAALAAFAAAHWVGALLWDPPLGAAAVAVAAACAGAGVLWRRTDGSLGWARAAAVGLAVAAVAAVALGLSPRLLAPSGWGELAGGIGQGLSGLTGAEFPYEGPNPWVRTAIALALALGLGLAAALYPRRRPGARSGLALALLAGAYAVAVTVNPPGSPLLWGAVLFALIACWLWLPGLDARAARAAAAALGAAAAVGLGAAALLDAEDPLVDWTSWRLPGDQPEVDYTWNHSYGPITWPREGTGLLRVGSDDPHYWRMVALDRFDGFRWEVGTEGAGASRPLELPSEVEPGAARRLDPDWVEETTFTVGALDAGLLPAPGAVLAVDGIDAVVPGSAATTLPPEPLREGDEYTVTSYAPEPSAERLRAAPAAYPRSLRRYTRIELPRRLAAGGGPGVYATETVAVPLRGEPGRAATRARLTRSAYGDVYALARRLTAGAATDYDAAAAIERHLRESYAYSESPPKRPLPLHAFLFRDRAGYCQQFSGSMALMLRMLGIPSRVASGFGPGRPEEDGDAFQVSDRDAHSWVEAYFSGIGWVTFEPTPAAAPAGRELAELAGARASAPAGGAPFRRGLVIPTVGGEGGADAGSPGAGPWAALAAALLALAGAAAAALAGLGAWLALRARRSARLDPALTAAAQARELERALPRLGFPIPPGATLAELERRHRGRRALSRYLAALRRSRYERGAAPPGAAERAALRRELAADRGLAGRLRALLAIPPGAPRPG